jgi:hypothetical protein
MELEVTSKLLILGSLISVFASHPAFAKEPRITQFYGYSVTISVRVTKPAAPNINQ